MKTKLFHSIILISLLASCKKDNTDNNTVATDVSGKVKRITLSYPGVRVADINDFEYDAGNRITKISNRQEDSTTSPVTVVYKNTTTFFYNGTDDKPFKDSMVFTGSGFTDIYKSFFTYDAQGRETKQENFNNTGTLVGYRLFTYGTNTVIGKLYDQTFTGSGVFFIRNFDTSFLDATMRIAEKRNYNSPNSFTGKETFTYDTKLNPLSLVNISKYLFYYGIDDDSHLFERSPNNMLVNVFQSVSGTIETTTMTSAYSSNNYPVSAKMTFTDNSSGSIIENYNITFEYY